MGADYFQRLVKELKSKACVFEDSIFRPDFSSLFNTRKLSLIKAKKYKWRRLKDLYKGKKIALLDCADPNNLSPRTDLCNFYFASALSALAERPGRLRRLFGQQALTDLGVYYVRVCQDGVWRHILIDDYIPVNEGDPGRPAFLGPRFLDKVCSNFRNFSGFFMEFQRKLKST